MGRSVPISDDSAEFLGFVSYRIMRLSVALSRHGSRTLRDGGGPSMMCWRVLCSLTATPTMTAEELCSELGEGGSAVSAALHGMAVAGHVDRIKRDSAPTRFALSAEGKALYERLLPTMRERQERIMSGLGAAERLILIRALTSIEANLADRSAGEAAA